MDRARWFNKEDDRRWERVPLFSFTPKTIQEASEVIRRAFIQNDCGVYEGFVCSMESALKECREDMETREKAEFIADYIMGVERR